MKPIMFPIWLVYLLYISNVVLWSFGSQVQPVEHSGTACISRAPVTRPPLAVKKTAVLQTAAGYVTDEYHWLRDDSHSDQNVLEYLAAENAYSDVSFARIQPLAEQLAKEMENRLSDVTLPLPVRQGRWWYYERQDPQQKHWVRYRRRVIQTAAPDGVLQDQDYEPAWLIDPGSSNISSSSSDNAAHTARSSAPEELVLDPNFECQQHVLALLGSQTAERTGSNSLENCDVWGSTVSPDGQLVAFGVDAYGTEQYQLMVRQISSSKALLTAPIVDTSGDYEWAADSKALFYVTRNSTTNRPDQVWFVQLTQRKVQPVQLWKEENPAFYLSISRSSSGRFLLLSIASEVTHQVLLLDLFKAHTPSPADWLALAPLQQGVQQQLVGHWQDWLFMLFVSPVLPNGELRVAHVNTPHQHMVLLPHRKHVELEDVRIFAHHLVLQERQLGHTTITVYCLPTNSSQAALAACRYNSTAASAAQAVEDAKADLRQQDNAVASDGSRNSFQSPHSSEDEDEPVVEEVAETDIFQAAVRDPEQLLETLPLLDTAIGVSAGNEHHQSGTFMVIRGRAGSAPESDHAELHCGDPAVAVEDQALLCQQHQGKQQQLQKQKLQQHEHKQSQHLPLRGRRPQRPAQGPVLAAANNAIKKSQRVAAVDSRQQAQEQAGGNASKLLAANRQAQGASTQPPLLSPENSWQVTFDEDAYSASIVDNGDWSHPMLRLSYTSFTTPQSIIDIDMFTQRRVVRFVTPVGGGFRPEAYRSYRLWVPADDGVEVPLSLVYRLDSFGRNGLNPALLLVYGAYGTKYDPEFDSRLLSLLDRGWLVGIAHVRGGGELGYQWHNAGRLEFKVNSFSDLLACAQALITQNMTSAGRLAVWGRSAGGLTVAAALNTAAELFQSAVLDVPFLDVLGDLVDAELPLTVKEWEEWGNPQTNETLAAIIASYSPVQNVDPVAVYPHMMVTTGLQDTRVGYWEAAKWVARLRAAAAAGSLQQRQQLLLLRTDPTGGHVSAGASSSIGEAAVKYAFLIATLPSCGSEYGLTGPDVQQQPAAIAVVRSAATNLDQLLAAGVTAMQLLPPVVHKLIMMLVAISIAAAALTVVWHASRFWLPAALNPADIAAALDSAVGSGAACIQQHHYSPDKEISSGSSKAVQCTAPHKDMSRRSSAASPVGLGSERQHLLVKQNRVSGASEAAYSCARPSPQSQPSSRMPPTMHSGPAAHVLSSASSLLQQQQQQQQLVYGGLVDDHLVDLLSGIPSSSRSGHHTQMRVSGHQFWHESGTQPPADDVFFRQSSHEGMALQLQSSSSSTGTNCSSAVLRPLSRTADRRTSTGL